MSDLSATTCEEVFARLADYLDRELSADEIRLVEDHLQICDVCASEFRFEESVLSGIKEHVRNDSVPDSLRQRVTDLLGRVATESGPPQ